MTNQKKMAGLGSKEIELLTLLGSFELRVFTVSEISDLLHISNVNTSQIIHRLVEKKRLQRIEKAKYILTQPEAWKAGEFAEKGIIVASQLIDPCYLSYSTALSYYGWSERLPKTIFIVTTSAKKAVEIRGISIRFVKLASKRFFGFEEHQVEGQEISVADKEKTIIDCLDQPRYCGEIIEVAKGLWSGRRDFDFNKLQDYAIKMDNGAVIKRLGYLLDMLGLNKPNIRKTLLKNRTPNLALLDPERKRSTGTRNKEWNLQVNINVKKLEALRSLRH